MRGSISFFLWRGIGYCWLMLICGGCGNDPGVNPLPVDQATPLSVSKSALPASGKVAVPDSLAQASIVIATVTEQGQPVANVEVALSRSISGLSPDYQWSARTNLDGRAEISLRGGLGRHGAAGYYLVRAVDPASGEVVGKWHSIPINGGNVTELSLEVGSPFQIVRSELLPSFEDRVFIIQTINGMPVEQFGEVIGERDDYDYPLEIRLQDYHPFLRVRGQVRFSHLGWMDITLGSRNGFFVLAEGLLGPRVEMVTFGGLTTTLNHISGYFAPTGPTIDPGMDYFVAQAE